MMPMKQKALAKAAFGLASMFGCYWCWSLLLAPLLAWPPPAQKLMGMVCLYGLGLAFFWLIAKPGCQEPQSNRSHLSVKAFLFCLLLQFTALMLFSILSTLLSALGFMQEPSTVENTTPYALLLLLVFNPIMEELVFRRLLGRLLLPHGRGLYVAASSFCFAVVHGVSLGLPQIGYTFLLGLLWAWVYSSTGSYGTVVLLHALSNLFGGVAVQWLMRLSEMAAGFYSMLLMALGAAGLCLLLHKRKQHAQQHAIGCAAGCEWTTMATNAGIWCYTMLAVVMMVLKKLL